MALIETLALSVGPAIAKAILKSWLRDSEVARDIASDLVGLFASITKDRVAQQRGKRQFEDIGETVAESLLPLFEGTDLDEANQEAVALAVAETLNNTPINPELLAQKDLDPIQLEKHLLASRPDATRDFSEAGTALYQRIISESASNIVDVASQLPSFTERTFAEVLTRQGQLLTVANQVLEEVRRIREESQQANPEAEAARFEQRYRHAVIRKLDELELFGVDVSTASSRHSLSVAYVTLSVEQRASTATEEQHLHPGTDRIEDTDASEESMEIISVEEALAGSRCLTIRGLAGSGKTTLLKWVAIHAASKTFENTLMDWNNTIPFFIRLRQCAESDLPRPEDFPGLVAPAIADTMPDGWVHDQLNSGRAIVLVDGVDEVPQLEREDVRTWLKDLAETYKKSRFIVSSRPPAIEEGWMEREGFGDTELQPMGLDDIDAFIDHWHQAVRERLEDEEDRTEIEGVAEHLKQGLRKSHPIRNLATSPLLCAMLCALHRDRRQQLPTDRIELYEACSHMLLERRDIERRIELRDYPQLSYRQKRNLLNDFAYWMLQNGHTMVTVGQAEERLGRKMTNMMGIGKGTTAADVRRLFVERSGMLREPVDGRIDFAHRTFQEFLAAQAALDEVDIGVLVSHGHRDQWREVIVLAAGLARRQDREGIISGLIERGDEDTDRRHQLHLLAVACLETATELEPSVHQEVRRRLARLVPPKNMTEAKDLASAGELAVPFLASGRNGWATAAAACVRALSLIGGEAALSTLERYRDDTRVRVRDELLKAWELFDPEEYARRVLPDVRNLELTTSRSVLLLLLRASHLIHLKSLSLDNFRGMGIGDLSPLTQLTNLSSLSLSRFEHVSDLSPLAQLTNLSSLSLSGFGQVSDLSPLAQLPNLPRLDLRHLPQVSDLSPLAELTNLSSLKLGGLPQVSDLSPLAELENLNRAFLIGLPEDVEVSEELAKHFTVNRFGPRTIRSSPLITLRRRR